MASHRYRVVYEWPEQDASGYGCVMATKITLHRTWIGAWLKLVYLWFVIHPLGVAVIQRRKPNKLTEGPYR